MSLEISIDPENIIRVGDRVITADCRISVATNDPLTLFATVFRLAAEHVTVAAYIPALRAGNFVVKYIR